MSGCAPCMLVCALGLANAWTGLLGHLCCCCYCKEKALKPSGSLGNVVLEAFYQCMLRVSSFKAWICTLWHPLLLQLPQIFVFGLPFFLQAHQNGKYWLWCDAHAPPSPLFTLCIIALHSKNLLLRLL